MPASSKHLRDLLKKKTSKTVLFAKWQSDKLYYVVRLLKIDPKKDKYLVEYEDKTEAWTSKEDLHLQFCSFKSPYQTEDDIVCCLCEGGTSEPPNEIVICDVCQQGFHQECNSPQIELLLERWTCETCCYILQIEPTTVPVMATSTPKKASTNVHRESSEESATEDAQESDDLVEPVQQLENGTTVEKMQPVLINVAKALVEKEANTIGTNEFVDVMAPPLKSGENSQPTAATEAIELPSRPIGTNKVPKKAAPAKALPKGKIPRKAPAPRAA